MNLEKIKVGAIVAMIPIGMAIAGVIWDLSKKITTLEVQQAMIILELKEEKDARKADEQNYDKLLWIIAKHVDSAEGK